MIERHDIVVSSVLFSVSSNFGVNAPQEVSVTRSEVSVYIYMRVSLLTSEICGTINIFFVLRPFFTESCVEFDKTNISSNWTANATTPATEFWE